MHGYDPAVEEWSIQPNEIGYDVVSCLDVLEHVEIQSIDAVLTNIKQLTRRFHLVIDLQPAVKKLPDGRNAHILLAPPDWWSLKISQYFNSKVSFPIFHDTGHIQKLVYVASNDPNTMPIMFLFLKMRLFGFAMKGGVLKSVKSN